MRYDNFISRHSRKQLFITCTLCVSWFLGLVTGWYCSCTNSLDLVSLMRTAASCRVSIVGITLSTLSPLIITGFIAIVSTPKLLLLIAFLRAFCFSYCAHLVTFAFPNAGWLVLVILFFRNFLWMFLLFRCWLSILTGEFLGKIRFALFCAIISLTLIAIEYVVILPFWVNLF